MRLFKSIQIFILIILLITTVYATPVKDDADVEENTVDNSISKKTSKKIKLYKPPLRQRRGAIRGVSIRFLVESKEERVVYKLLSPPKGMKIIETIFGRSCFTPSLGIGKSGILVQWDVPMDAIEGKAYAITVEATEKNHNPDYLPKKGRVTFYVKVPKTKPIQTKLANNELTVTDKNSLLYGMKMKGHSGEDISHMKLRSVAYEDVWPIKVRNNLESYAFVVYNKPPKVHMDLSNISHSNFLKFNENTVFGNVWKSIVHTYLIDAKDAWDSTTGRYIVKSNMEKILQHNEYDDGGTKLYLVVKESR